MIIPSSSDVLINGVSPITLCLAVILSKNGLKVLLIDEEDQLILNNNQLVLDDYCISFLKANDFIFDEDASTFKGIGTENFAKQSFRLLAENLGNVIWAVKIITSAKLQTELVFSHQEKRFSHQTKYLVNDFELAIGPDEINFRNVFLLAWRLIGIVNGVLHPDILNNHHQEKELIKLQYQNSSKDSKRNIIQKILQNLSKIHPQYQLTDSKISLHLSQKRNLEAGYLLPDIPFFDEKLKENSSLHKWCSYKYFSIILFGYLLPTNLFAVARWVQLNYPVQLFYLPYSEKNQSVFEELKILNGEKKTLIIRPDKFIGLLHDGIDIDIIDNYLRNFIKMNEKAKPKID